jgi:hypothetical protein
VCLQVGKAAALPHSGQSGSCQGSGLEGVAGKGAEAEGATGHNKAGARHESLPALAVVLRLLRGGAVREWGVRKMELEGVDAKEPSFHRCVCACVYACVCVCLCVCM